MHRPDGADFEKTNAEEIVKVKINARFSFSTRCVRLAFFIQANII